MRQAEPLHRLLRVRGHANSQAVPHSQGVLTFRSTLVGCQTMIPIRSFHDLFGHATAEGMACS
jgi:hypothetical protein